jgi:hypothetical protein
MGAPSADGTFSVVIPSYNRADLVPQTIDSVLAQTDRDFEVIVVDDGSTDGTGEVLRRYGDRIRYVQQNNGGLAAARNRGIREANGVFVAFLDSDDLYEAEFIRRVRETFREFPDAGAVFVAEREFVTTGGPLGPVMTKRTPGRYFTPAGMVGRDTGVGSGRPPVIRRSVLAAHAGFNESLRCAVDSEMWIRLSFDVPMVVLSEPLIRRRYHAGNLSGDQVKDAEDWLTILAWLRDAHPGFVREHARVYRRTLAKNHLRVGRELLAREGRDPERLARARRELAAAVRAYPTMRRALIYLAWSYVAPSTYPRWRRFERRREAARGPGSRLR